MEKPNLKDMLRIARTSAEELLGKRFESISSISRTEDGWIVNVEVLERRAIPDTQDIIGRYEMSFDENGDITGYRRMELRHRGGLERIEEE
ncbi:MAG: gas vesicle protein [Methanothrix sp.]|jgi:Gas vesicle synthesis protein GvpO.|uniref:Gas vesicle synthesis family protein n=1 Tax=Methanothrix thermoacetophila (strain DSM 6194 / JCM 14653 / NBRC 101360 / PT) TaxID=349307 RepID=A0B584_METTP|nr:MULTISPECIES: gas vesicle protein [Methanothrix]ABK13858.1 Gas vesicle synthesis family protein [Methanothrix thermoacetophila PT]MBC7079966.1 gas vesicle protein [Methanothrix sp.]NPU88115.1 gas vesicle protein [Methanothrix sp.]